MKKLILLFCISLNSVGISQAISVEGLPKGWQERDHVVINWKSVKKNRIIMAATWLATGAGAIAMHGEKNNPVLVAVGAAVFLVGLLPSIIIPMLVLSDNSAASNREGPVLIFLKEGVWCGSGYQHLLKWDEIQSIVSIYPQLQIVAKKSNGMSGLYCVPLDYVDATEGKICNLIEEFSGDKRFGVSESVTPTQ